MKKLYLGRDKKLCGVCAGIGNYFDLDPTLIRIGFLMLTPYMAFFPVILLYLILALVFPHAPDDYVETNTGKLLTKGREKKIAGICSGFAGYFNFDATVIRLIFIILLLFIGGGLWLYLVCSLIMPSYHAPDEYI